MDALDIFEPAGIRFVSVQHEQNAVHMADGYARHVATLLNLTRFWKRYLKRRFPVAFP